MVETPVKLIREWLIINAPRIPELSLNVGANEQEIATLERAIGNTLPTDFKELYRTWNGMNELENWGNLFYGMSFFTVAEIIADHEWRANLSRRSGNIALKNADPEIDPTNLYNPAWISIGTDGSRSTLHLDLAPGSLGRRGQIIFTDGEYRAGITVASSTLDLLWKFANDLNNNLYSLEPDALEEGQHFLLPDKQIDLINSFASEKWKHLYRD